MTLRIGARSALQKWGDPIAVVCAAVVILSPLLASVSRVPPDLTNHLWTVRVEAQAISRHLAPTYYMNASAVGVYYPLFVFYGGTLYAAVGALVALLGHAQLAYFGSTGLAVMAAYGGWLWLSRQLGVRSWYAHAPALTYVGSAYYVTNLYGRGAWPEFIATSIIPLLAASAWRVVTSARIEPIPAMLLVASSVFFAGSHNITLVLGSLVLIVAILLLSLAVGRGLLPRGIRRLLQAAGLVLLGVAVDAWFLLPDLAHAAQTQISAQSAVLPWAETGFFNTPGVLFNPLRAVPSQSTTPALYVQAPDWFLLWVLVAGAATWSRAPRRLRRIGLALVSLLAILLALIMIEPLWDAMPRLVQSVQFPYRLNSYVALCASGLVLAALAAVDHIHDAARKLLGAALAAAMAISLSLCVWQLWEPPVDPVFYSSLLNAYTSVHVNPGTWSAAGDDYADSSQRVIPTAPSANLTIDPAAINAARVTLSVTPPAGTAPFATNIAGGPYAVRVSGGVVRVGRTSTGFAVLRRRSAGAGPVTVSLAPAGGALTVGKIVSLAALTGILAMVVWWPMYGLGAWYGRRRTASGRG